MTLESTVVPPLTQWGRGIPSKTLSGCLNPQRILNPTYTVFFLYIQTYDKVQFINEAQ